MRDFSLRVLSADEPIYDGSCVSLQFPCTDGQYGVQAGHVPMLAAVVPGLLSFRSGEGEEAKLVSVSNGMVKVERDQVLVLLDSAEWLEDIDENRARRDVEEAERILREEHSRREYLAARSDLERALSRLHLKEKADRYRVREED